MPFVDKFPLRSSLRYWVWWIKSERKISISSDEICCCFSSWHRRSLYHNDSSLWITRKKCILFSLSICLLSSTAWHHRRIERSRWEKRALLKLNPWSRKQLKIWFNSWILFSISVEDPKSDLENSNDNFTKEIDWFEIVILRSFWLRTNCWVVIVARSNHQEFAADLILQSIGWRNSKNRFIVCQDSDPTWESLKNWFCQAITA